MIRKLEFTWPQNGNIHRYKITREPGKLVFTRNIGNGWEPMSKEHLVSFSSNDDTLRVMYIRSGWTCTVDTFEYKDAKDLMASQKPTKCTCDFNWPNTFLGCRCGAFKAERGA